MSSHLRPRGTRRTALTAGAALATAALLAGCGGGPSAVSDVQGVKPATMLITGQGTFIEPGTLEPSEVAWIGTGWFFTPDGYAVTNNHVVTGAGTLSVAIGGDENETHPARVVGASECYDLAVIKVDLDAPAPFLAWYSGDITEGLEVYSAGYPGSLGAEYTLTKGIVSQADTAIATSWADVEHAIQHDARIRGGNSGGPLVDPQARVVGVNYAGDDVSDSNIAIGRGSAAETIQRLKAGEAVLSLGINGQANAPTDTGAANGIWVSSVLPGGAADKAGIEPGDVIDKLNGVTMGEGGSIAGYCDVLRTNGVDATFDVSVWRPSTGEILTGQINGDPIVATSTVAPQEPTVGGFVDIVDDSGAIGLSVPDTWSQVDGSSFTDDAGVQWATLTASPDIAAYQAAFDVPGVTFAATPAGGADPAAVLAQLDSQIGQYCTATAQQESFADGYATGQYSYWSACAGGTTEFVVVAAETDDGGAVFWFTVQMVDQVDATTVLDTILASYAVQF